MMPFGECAEHPLFRPPGEADSLIFRIADGCPSNTCAFCGMYKGVPYREHPWETVRKAIHRTASTWPDAKRVFLADGDIMHLETDSLRRVLTELGDAFPRLVRVSLYANGSSILAKSADELRDLQALKLHTLYMGLESGDAETLRRMRKGETVNTMVAAAQLAQDCGLRMSVMVLLGLGGCERTLEHAQGTAEALNVMQPRLLSALRVVPIEGTRLEEEVRSGAFRLLSEYDTVRELRHILGSLELTHTVFRANHTSNIIPLEGRFPKDRERLVDELDQELASGLLDRHSPGAMPFWL